MQSSDGSRSTLATRSLPDPTTELPYYIFLFTAAKTNEWSAKNPEGSIILSVAENNLSVDLLQEKIKETVDFPDHVFCYGDSSGDMRLKGALVNILQSTFLQNDTLDPSKLIISAGCSCILEALFFTILDEGDGVLIPAPYYPGYRFDIGFRARGKLIGVYLDDKGDVAQQLTEAKIRSDKNGIPIRALLITHPDNPTGTLYSESTLTDIATWCADQNLHLVANEVYGNSVFKEEPLPFKSLYAIGRELQREELQERLHLIYGLSKDFCSSGVRVGAFYSESQPVLQRMQSGTLMTAASLPVQHIFGTILQDLKFVEFFISENKKRLRHNYDTLTDALKDAKIPFRDAQAGIFLMIDLRRALKSQDFESEKELCLALAEKGVLLSPGESCSCQLPGFFRLCFATVSSDALRVAVHRIEQFMRS